MTCPLSMNRASRRMPSFSRTRPEDDEESAQGGLPFKLRAGVVGMTRRHSGFEAAMEDALRRLKIVA
ncbi:MULTISPECIES: hypothetical protein [Nonomuraea]|uniref:Uncharacterized protein n=1 Tax=Nonomuraea mangrovi TaxID=2316207 RepID=A0ABW4SXG1_9ACTN